MNIGLWIDEGVEEAFEKEKEEADEKKTKCACGRAVCCGKHKGKGQCPCQNNSRQKD